MKLNILEAKNRLSELVRLAQSGEDVVIADRGEPVVRMVPIDRSTAPVSEPGSSAGILAWLAAHRLPAYARRSAEEIDASIEAERAAWD